MATPYRLRCNLTGHGKDVRALCTTVFPENGLVSGSRDNTSCIWVENEGDQSFHQELVMRGHSNFVSCLCIMPPDDTYPQGLIITGSNDKTILAYTPGNAEPVFKLTGHEGNVCALASGKFGLLLSGSWDTSARVWLNQKCIMVLEGHQMAVWAVGIISGQGIMLTGSADKAIKSWKAGKCLKTFKGHEDCVRALGVVSEGEFLSAANDATIRRWAVTSGDCLAVYFGHTNYVYSLCMLPNGEDFVTGGEDRTLRVWHDGTNTQTLYHPCESVWAVTALPNGDIASGASDGVIRVFTQSADRMANEEVLAAHEAALATAPATSQPLGDIKVEDLPGPDALNKAGKKDGQTTMINNGDGTVDVYQWDAGQSKWVKVGNVVGSSGSSQRTSGKTLYEGKEYDYVFSVDIKEGAPPLKLPYNISEEPWMAAQRFLHKHDLPQAFLDQVANFIVENTKGVTLGTGSVATNSDPFTGGDRYIPGKEDFSTSGAPAGMSDPFTGGSRYIPEGLDSKAASNSHFPVMSCVFFETISPSQQVIGKLKEFNRCLEPDTQVPEGAIDSLQGLLEGKPTSEGITTLDRLLTWPQEYVFPALDILRMVVREAEINKLFSSRPDFAQVLCQLTCSGNPSSCRMLALRTLTNLFSHEEGSALNLKHIDSVLQSTIACKDMTMKNGQVAAATLILNYCVKLQPADDLENKSKCLQAVGELLPQNLDPEAVYRLLVAMGTLISGDDGCKAVAHSIDLLPAVSQFHSSQTGKLAECSRLLTSSLS